MKALVYKNRVMDLQEQEHEVHPDNTWMDAPEGCETGWILVDGELVAPPTPDPVPYDVERMIAYPSIQEQLDMQYWDSVNGTTTWADAIAAVKAQYPKPE